jgi:hypothetical protein
LERLLASSHLRNSKRCQALLRYVVEAWLEGALERVKERTIGIEVFHREPRYDTNQDSVVRTTAAEVRKRLAQYYLEPDHRNEPRVSLPNGSYIPEFHVAPVDPGPVPVRHSRRSWWLAAGALAAVVGVSLSLLPRLRHTELDHFWEPLVDDDADAIVCIGQPTRVYTFEGSRADDLNQAMVGGDTAPPLEPEGRRRTTLNLGDLAPVGGRYYASGDVMAAMRISELLAGKRKSFRIMGDRNAGYADLRGHPAVLIGHFNNRWTMTLTSGFRFYLERNNQTRSYEVRDRLNPGKVVGAVHRSSTRPEEYAIVSRVFDRSTEKTVITVAGMTYTGTIAAADFLTRPAYVGEAFGRAPSGWEHRNLQIVVKTTLVGGNAGPPRAAALHIW